MIHIFTLSWNGLDKLIKLKSGLINNLIKCNEEYLWYIKDNGSKDGTSEEINKWNNVKLLQSINNNDSFSKGINLLSNIAKNNTNYNDKYLILNNDIIFNNEFSLLNMFKLLSNEVAIVGAKLKYTNTNKLQHAGVIFSKQYGNLPYHYRYKEEESDRDSMNREFQAVTGAVMAINPKHFWEIGGLDENLFWMYEDIKFCLDIKNIGKKIVYCGQTDIYHEESATLKKNPVNKLFLNQNLNYFKKTCSDKYEIDHQKYLDNIDYNLYKIK